MIENPTMSEVDALLAAANPIAAPQAATLDVRPGLEELRAAVLSQPPDVRVAVRASRLRRRTGRRIAVALAVVCAGSIAVLSLAAGSGHRGGTAWAAELVRFAQASPLLLLDAPGWRVEYADEYSEQEGEIHFRLGPTPPPSRTAFPAGQQPDLPNTTAQLNWRSGALAFWMRDRKASADFSTTSPVLGSTAHVYHYAGGRPGHEAFTGLWREDGRVLEFAAVVADVDAFRKLLAALAHVDTNAWLSAMPASVVKTDDRSRVIAEMLSGVTLPPGFDPATIKGARLVKDRYQLGAAVTGSVACTWIKRWSDARKRGDDPGVQEAIAAMATAKHWPILQEMAKSGAYPEVLEDFAAAMPSGLWSGRPLEGDVDSGLGCPQLGIPLA